MPSQDAGVICNTGMYIRCSQLQFGAKFGIVCVDDAQYNNSESRLADCSTMYTFTGLLDAGVLSRSGYQKHNSYHNYGTKSVKLNAVSYISKKDCDHSGL